MVHAIMGGMAGKAAVHQPRNSGRRSGYSTFSWHSSLPTHCPAHTHIRQYKHQYKPTGVKPLFHKKRRCYAEWQITSSEVEVGW